MCGTALKNTSVLFPFSSQQAYQVSSIVRFQNIPQNKTKMHICVYTSSVRLYAIVLRGHFSPVELYQHKLHDWLLQQKEKVVLKQRLLPQWKKKKKSMKVKWTRDFVWVAVNTTEELWILKGQQIN